MRLIATMLLVAWVVVAPAPAQALDPGTYPAILDISVTGVVQVRVQTTIQVDIWTLEIILSGSGCTPNPAVGSHVLQDGSILTLSATCSGSFVSWSGDTGCAGGQSHSITMNGNKRCTLTATP